MRIKLSADSNIFKSCLVLVKQRTILSAESNFDSDGALRFSIKKIIQDPKKTKTTFFMPKNRGKMRFSA
jgi:hypothetical protein